MTMTTGAELYQRARRRLGLPEDLSPETVARIARLVDGPDTTAAGAHLQDERPAA